LQKLYVDSSRCYRSTYTPKT